MRGTVALLALPLLAGSSTPAYADEPTPPGAELRMVYEHPEIAADASGVTWHWVLTNRGVVGAEGIVATHHVSTDQKIIGISSPCTVQVNDVMCPYATILPGEKRTGWIKTKIATGGGMLRVNAQVTWRESRGILPDLGDPSVVNAGRTSESWGESGTDATAEAPATMDKRLGNVAG
jgi:hypothetical protein